MASENFTTTPEIKAPVDVAAAAGNYTSFQVPVHGSMVPPVSSTTPAEHSDMKYQKEVTTYTLFGETKLLQNGVEVKFELCGKGSRALNEQLDHTNLLRGRRIPNMKLSNQDVYVYEGYDQSLAEYLKKIEQEHPKGKFYHFVEKTSEKKYSFLKEKIKKVMRAIISVVRYLHSKDLALENKLSSDNFVFQKGVVKVWKLDLKIGDKQKRLDWLKVSSYISFLSTGEPLVESLNHLVYLMGNYSSLSRLSKYSDSGVEYEELLSMHISLMNHSERVHFVKNLIDRLPGLKGEEKHEYDCALRDMGHNNNWIDEFTTAFDFVKDFIVHKCRKVDEPDLSVLDSYSEYYWDNFYLSELRELVSDSDSKCNKNLIRMCRNLSTHLYEYARERSPLTRITDKWVDAAVMDLFGWQLAKFQEELNRKGILRHFMPAQGQAPSLT